ncbi:cell division protein FtsA [Neobacillus sp. SM06]|uniref:cell division protein FtsA n=1 Tax=Neobacillus sp. SM06 TaxID=3422492 RepID=UPI003D2D1100
MQKNKKIFALDIGTRSVVGIILEKMDGIFQVVDILSKEHAERAMLDGQIHDVLAVSKVITGIKEALEEKHGSLHNVCVAAAGRSLKTERAKAVVSIQGKPMMLKQDILHLELTAVQSAQAKVAEKQSSTQSHTYYCVGYSVLYYHLDGEEIGNLIDQQGTEASAEIIATFLPKVVVESLMAALHRSGLEMEALTLEPIAAINVLIPPSMRRLNVALVDIGAGTSDIAITDSGTVVAYGMVPVAGDEITEAISDQFLLDFPLAEQAKRELNTKEQITITDILGFETTIESPEVISQINPALDHLAAAICQEISRLNNNKPPKAVMLVGGGSLTPKLPEKMAAILQLPANRVAIRGIDAISSLTIAEHIQRGPELVTPIGIAIAAQSTPVQYVSINVNGNPVRLFDIKEVTVGDSLITAGIKMSKLYGKPGLAKIVTLNNQMVTIPGKLGEAPILLLNDKSCSLDDPVQNGDQIIVEKGADGQPTALQIKDLIDHIPNSNLTVNGEALEISPVVICNGVVTTNTKMVEDRDEIIYRHPETIEELLEHIDRADDFTALEPFYLTVNGIEMEVPFASGKLLLNGAETTKNAPVQDTDRIEMVNGKKVTVKRFAEWKNIQLEKSIPIFFNGKQMTLSKKAADVIRDGHALKENDELFSGDHLTIVDHPSDPFIFQDLFRQVEIEVPEKTTGPYILLKNNQPTTFYDQVNSGDDLKIVWPLAEKVY